MPSGPFDCVSRPTSEEGDLKPWDESRLKGGWKDRWGVKEDGKEKEMGVEFTTVRSLKTGT